MSAQQVDVFIEDLNTAYEKASCCDGDDGVIVFLCSLSCHKFWSTYIDVHPAPRCDLSSTPHPRISTNAHPTHLQVHKTYEDNFWATKMGLSGCSAQSLAASKNAYDAFLADPNNLQAVRSMLNTSGITDEQKKVL